MISSVNNVAPAQPATQAATAQPASSQPASQPAASDTVQTSNAAKAMLQESLETPAQTAKEASAGDLQAVKLLARHATHKASGK
jgi:hypothetical protein